MKLIRKAKDERVVAEINRIYKVGFYFLTAGILADLVLQALGISVQNETIGGAVNLVEFAVVMLAQLFCLVLMARKGMMTTRLPKRTVIRGSTTWCRGRWRE